MLVCYEALARNPERFAAVAGVSVAAFDTIVATLTPLYIEAERKRLNTAVRLSAPGAGRPAKLATRDRILMAVMWLRHHPTHDALAVLFQIDHSNVTRLLTRIVPLLERTGHDAMRQPDPGKNRRPTLAAMLAVLPERAAPERPPRLRSKAARRAAGCARNDGIMACSEHA